MSQKFQSQPLVSIVSPCYNVAPFLNRFFESLIAQTYKNLEIILVNDGSTDQTAGIIQSYIPKLKSEGYSVLYIEQSNQGPSSTVNTGIKYATGAYLTWPDPDDWFAPASIETKLNFLIKHPEVAVVRSNIQAIDEITGKKELWDKPERGNVELPHFALTLLYGNTWFAPVSYMVRTSYLDLVIPERKIFFQRDGGQNYQLLLPLADHYSCWQISDLVDFYCVRPGSHSKNHTTYEEQIIYHSAHERILYNTIPGLPHEKSFYPIIQKKYNFIRLQLAFKHHRLSDFFHYLRHAYKLASTAKERLSILPKLILPNSVYHALRKLFFLLHP